MKTKTFFSAALSVAIIAMSSCGGNSKQPQPENIDAPSLASVKGDEVYKRTCLACHQPNGEGIANTFPPLAKSDFLVNKESVIGQVIHGKKGEMIVNGVKYNNMMPAQNLSDPEIAAVLTYVYNNFGNAGGSFSVEEVSAVREKLR